MAFQQENLQDEAKRRNRGGISVGWVALLLLGAAALACVYGGGMGSQPSERFTEANAHLGRRSLQGATPGPTESPNGPIFETLVPGSCRFPNGNVLWRVSVSESMEFWYWFANPSGYGYYPSIPGSSPFCHLWVCSSLHFFVEAQEIVSFEAPADLVRMVFRCGMDESELCLEALYAPSDLPECT